jgi:hypothetical protein
MNFSRLAAAVVLVLATAFIAAGAEQAVGVITRANGNITVYRANAQKSAARVAEVLAPGYRIATGSDGQVEFLFCPGQLTAELGPNAEVELSGDKIVVKKGELRNPRKVPRCRMPALAARSSATGQLGGMVLREAGGPRQSSLTLVAPLATTIFEFPVRLRWKAAAEASEYRVEVRGDGGAIAWSSSTPRAEVDVPAGPALRRGETYRWRVFAMQAGEMLSSASSSFRLASADEAARIEAARKAVAADPSGPQVGARLLLAFLYEEAGAWDLALEQYERVPVSSDTPEWLREKVRVLKEQTVLPQGR